jgi:hypothetical protein
MRTTVTLDDDVFQAVQALAKGSDKRIGQVLSELVRRALRAESRTTKRKSGLPVFKVSSKARIIPSSRASAILAAGPG